MLSKLRTRLTFANVVSVIALFVALGGSSYAAITITGKNVKNSSLTGSDVKNSSLTTSDVKNRSLLARDFKSGQLPAGPQGAQGPKGDKGDTGATGPFPEGDLPSGKTVRGTFSAEGWTPTSSFHASRDSISFGYRFSASVTARYINDNATPPSQCPGTPANPEAQPGNLCIYETVRAGADSVCVIEPVGDFCGTTTSRVGAEVYASGTSTQQVVQGTWAATAP